MCECCGFGMGRSMKRPSVQQTTNASTTVHEVEIVKPSTKAAVGGGEDGRTGSTTGHAARAALGPREASERRASAGY